MGFLELHRYLRSFVDNEDKVRPPCDLHVTVRHRRLCLQLWTLCVRTKRGLVDTGRPGGYCKDQVSFAGLMQLLMNRKSISFELLHSCKLPWHCIAATPGLQRAADVGAAMLVPAFIADGEAAYQLRLDALVQVLPAADRAGSS